MNFPTLLVATLTLAATTTTATRAGDVAELEITRFTLGGGGSSVNETFELTGSIGPPDAGPALGGSDFELQGGFWAIVPASPCPGDLNGDDFVDAGDLATLLAAWGDCAPACPEDLDASGAVDAGDLATLLAGWGACHP